MSSCFPLSSKDCNGVCNGPSILDCAGTCYNPTINPIPPHVRDCAGVCYDPTTEDPPNFYDRNGNCVDHLDCPPEPPEPKHCEIEEEILPPPIPREKIHHKKYCFLLPLIILLILYIFIWTRKEQNE